MLVRTTPAAMLPCPADALAARRLDTVAFVLAAGAVMAPVGVAALGFGDDWDALWDLGRALAVLALGGAVAWSATQRGDARARAWGRVVVAVVACALSVAAATQMVSVGRVHTEGAGPPAEEEHLRRLWNLTERLTPFHFPAALGPEVVATPTGLARVQATLEKYRSLLAARDALLGARPLRLPGAPALPAEVVARYEALSQRQALLAERASSLIDWYASRAPRVQWTGGRVRFEEAAQEDAFRARLLEVATADREVRLELQRLMATPGAVWAEPRGAEGG